MADISSLVILDDGGFTTNQTLSQCMVIWGNTDHLLAEKALAAGLAIGFTVAILSIIGALILYAKLQSNKS